MKTVLKILPIHDAQAQPASVLDRDTRCAKNPSKRKPDFALAEQAPFRTGRFFVSIGPHVVQTGVVRFGQKLNQVEKFVLVSIERLNQAGDIGLIGGRFFDWNRIEGVKVILIAKGADSVLSGSRDDRTYLKFFTL